MIKTMKTFWIAFLGCNVIALMLAYLVINEIMTKRTVGLIVFCLLSLAGFIFMILSIIKSIRFNKALKAYQKELPELIKAGLVDPGKIINAKFPEIF